MGKALGSAGDLLNTALGGLFGGEAVKFLGLTPLVQDEQGLSDGRDPTEFSYKVDAGLPFPFGRVACGGDVNYRIAYDATNRYQSIFATIAASGPIQSIQSFAADDELTSFDPTLNRATNGEHQDNMWLQTKLGTQPQAALTSPTGTGAGIPAPGWTTDHKQSGRAVYCLTMFENSKLTEYPGGIVRPLFVIEGLYGWDPRQDSTWPGGSGSCRLDDPSTWVYINDGALAGLNWAIGRWEGLAAGYSPARYGVPYASSLVGGIGASLDSIDVDSFVNAANVAEANSWAIAAYPTSKDDKFEVLTKLLAAAGSEPARIAGKISCVCHTEVVASSVTVSAADTAGPIEIVLAKSRLERRNAIIPRFWSEAQHWEMTAIDEIVNEDWVTEDGGKRGRSVDLPYVGLADQAAQLGYYVLANGREPITGVAPFKPHMRRIRPGDCFTWSLPDLPLDGIKVKCLKRRYDPMTGVVRITFRSEDDAKHTDAYEQTGVTPPPVDPDAPPPVYVEPPSEIAISDDGTDVLINYRNPFTTFDRVDLYRGTTATFSAASVISFYGGALGEYVPGQEDTPGAGTWYYWTVTVDADGNLSDEDQPGLPLTVTIP